MAGLTAEIKECALGLGFQKIGIARAEFLDGESRKLHEWLARGYHGTMEWMAAGAGKRGDPRNVLPGARSVVAVAMNYYTPGEHTNEALRGKISRYAWGDDYHDVLLVRLNDLLAFIKERRPDAAGKVYVDTGPVMEKVWAARAGIGWEGKHTNVITEEYGSWVFLGEMILDIALEY